MLDIAQLNFEKGNGLVTVVAQDAVTGVVLMVAHADREALERTLNSGEMHYHSRSRGPWHKGATSGNTQRVVTLCADCDGDAVLARVIPNGPACHLGTVSCFGDMPEAGALTTLDGVIAGRATAALEEKPSYTRKLLADRNLRLKKIGEEAAELVTACADERSADAVQEAADLLYHMLVALCALGVGLKDVQSALASRAEAWSKAPKLA